MRSILGWGNATCTNGHVRVSIGVFRGGVEGRSCGDRRRRPVARQLSRLGARRGYLGDVRDSYGGVGQGREASGGVVLLASRVEDIGWRIVDWADERGPDGRVGARQPPVRHYQLHYQVSAWAKSVDDEHRLLGRVMEGAPRGEAVASELLAGVLEGEEQPLLVRLGVPVPDPVDPHDVWSSLGMPLRASIDLTLVAPLRPALDTEIAPPAEELTMEMEWIGPGSRRSQRAMPVCSPSGGGRPFESARNRRRTILDDSGLDRGGDRV